jgi:hypothetical protein
MKKYSIQLDIDESGAIKNVDKVAGTLDVATQSAVNLKQQLREMQKQLSSLDSNSEEFQKLSKEAGELKDRIKDASEAINRQAGSSFERLSNNAAGLRESLFNLDFEQVGSSLKGLAGTVKGFTFEEFSSGLKNVTSGLVSLGKSLLTNPLFLIITSGALIISNFEKITALFDGVTDQQLQAAEAQQKSADAAKAQYDAISATENTLKLQGKSEKEILDLKKQALDTAILEQQVTVETQQTILDGQVAAAARNKLILKGILDFITTPIQLILKGIDTIGSTFGQNFGLESTFAKGIESIASAVFNPQEVQAEGQKTIDEAKKKLADLQNTRDGFELQEQEKARAAAAERQKIRDEEIKQLRDQQAKVFELQQKLREQVEKSLPGQKSQLSQLTSENDERFKILQQQQELELSLMKEGEEKEIALVDEKYIKLREQAAGNAELLKQLAIANGDEVAAIQEQYRQQEIERERALTASKVQVASDTIGALIAINDSFGAQNEAQAKRQFNINKGLSIAQALIQTYQSANAAFAAAAANPLTIAFPGFPFVQAGLAVAAGLAQVNKIRQTTFNSSGGGGSASAGGSASVSASAGGGTGGGAPQFNPVNTDFVNSRPPQPPRAYVVANDVIKGVEATEQIDRQARL